MLIASFQTWKSRSSSSFLQAALRIFPHWAFYLTLKWHTLIGPPSKLNLFNSLLDLRGKTGFVLHTLIVLLFLRHHRRSFCSNILQHVGSILTHTGRQTCLTLALSLCLFVTLSLTRSLFVPAAVQILAFLCRLITLLCSTLHLCAWRHMQTLSVITQRHTHTSPGVPAEPEEEERGWKKLA